LAIDDVPKKGDKQENNLFYAFDSLETGIFVEWWSQYILEKVRIVELHRKVRIALQTKHMPPG
jgi:hypothetical protein